ncbi:MAG: hypothetical protein JWM32_2208 [Verrucomicrobia bacterium]|nr:hypothetical protein [Verrucomicrobiota bacterium]
MNREILIVGQGLAGTMLGAEFERAGIPFRIVDAGHMGAASRVAAGIVNPVTGRRLVKSWKIEELLPLARKTYGALESTLGGALWRDMRVRRVFADERERRVFTERSAKGELGPYAGIADDEGGWIEGAGHVDVEALLAHARARWLKLGVLEERRIEWADVIGRWELVIDCSGRAGNQFGFVPWEYSKGEILTIAVEGLEPDVVLNSGRWILPLAGGRGKVGATHQAGSTDTIPTASARAALEASAAALLKRSYIIEGQAAGVRVNLPDRRPVVGRHPSISRLGIINGLGSKGVSLAPWLARQWVNHLTEGVPFDPEADVSRFQLSRSSQASTR